MTRPKVNHIQLTEVDIKRLKGHEEKGYLSWTISTRTNLHHFTLAAGLGKERFKI